MLFFLYFNSVEKLVIHLANDPDRELASRLLASSEPWIKLGLTLAQCRQNCHDPEFMLYVAYIDQQPTGIMLLDPRGLAGSPYVKSIAVFPEYRGKGIGTALLTFAEDHFRDKARFLFLCVSSFNRNARRFYERLGYQVAGELNNYLIEGESEILMGKRL